MTNQNNQKYYPSLHTLIYGVPHAWKSTFAATYPKPMVVFMFDPIGKEFPYFKEGKAIKRVGQDQFGTQVTEVYDEKDKMMIRVESYTDVDYENPTAADRFSHRIVQFRQEVQYWRTAVVDSVTFMELAFRLQAKKLTGAFSKAGNKAE